jgi:hypothetical protein
MGRISSHPITVERLPKLKVSDFTRNARGNGTLAVRSNGKRQIIELVSVPSNLGKGVRWYFVCPVTGLRAVNLYRHNGLFVHRKAIANAYYEKQIESPTKRMFRTLFETLDQMEKETDPERLERIAERHDRYAEQLKKRYQPKLIETVYDPKEWRIVSKAVNGNRKIGQ